MFGDSGEAQVETAVDVTMVTNKLHGFLTESNKCPCTSKQADPVQKPPDKQRLVNKAASEA